MKHVRLALGQSGVGGRFPRRRRRRRRHRRRHRRRRCRRRLRRCRHILGIPFRPGAIFLSVAGGGGESFDYIPTVTSPRPRILSLAWPLWCLAPLTAVVCFSAAAIASAMAVVASAMVAITCFRSAPAAPASRCSCCSCVLASSLSRSAVFLRFRGRSASLGRLAGWLAGSLYRRRRLGCRCLLRSRVFSLLRLSPAWRLRPGVLLPGLGRYAARSRTIRRSPL